MPDFSRTKRGKRHSFVLPPRPQLHGPWIKQEAGLAPSLPTPAMLQSVTTPAGTAPAAAKKAGRATVQTEALKAHLLHLARPPPPRPPPRVPCLLPV